jgi:hypothetical protein
MKKFLPFSCEKISTAPKLSGSRMISIIRKEKKRKTTLLKLASKGNKRGPNRGLS